MTYKLNSKCTIEGCNKLHKARGLCTAHYQEWRVYRQDTKLCSVDNCNKSALSRGWCNAHYTRWRLHGNPLVNNRLQPKDTAARSVVILDYKHNSKRREIEWKLDDNVLDTLFLSNCYYCGAKPNNVKKGIRLNGTFTYNGIDRVDNNKGYTEGNVVSCCSACNRSKGIRSKEEYVLHCLRVVENSLDLLLIEE